MRKRQAELASRAAADTAAGQAGDPGRVTVEGSWTADPQLPGLVKPEAKQEVLLLSFPFQVARLTAVADAEQLDGTPYLLK